MVLKLLIAYFKFNIYHNFDITTGYNIFGFDDRYLHKRVLELKFYCPKLLHFEML
jgi:DNA polymerase elongation subunit (family B)